MAGDLRAGIEVHPVTNLFGRRGFVDVPFRLHGHDPAWVPPLRVSVYDRISPRHPAAQHQDVALWVARRGRRPVGRIGACIDHAFDRHQQVRWGWVGFFEALDDDEAAGALFDAACSWARRRGATTCVGPANFTTNDELGLMIDGFDEPPAVLTLQNPPYYERLWTGAGWTPAMDLWGWHFDKSSTALSERQRRTLARMRDRAGVTIRGIDMDDFDNEVSRFFEVYNAAWQDNWGFAPMPEKEVRHLARQLRWIINPQWAFGAQDRNGEVVGVCLALPDVNRVMIRLRSGRLLPTGWVRLLAARRSLPHARVWALGIRPDRQHLALGPLLYQEIVDRLAADPHIRSAEGGWTLATNHRINGQLEAMGAHRSKVWRLYQRPA